MSGVAGHDDKPTVQVGDTHVVLQIDKRIVGAGRCGI
jgi:hypothetical protein